jgi:hypothetical protein
MPTATPLTTYYDQTNAPRLVRSYCVFVDFLGFRHEIKTAVELGNEDEVFQRFMRMVEPEIKQLVPSEKDSIEGWPRMWDAKVFTDNVVLGYALWSGHGEKEFGQAICQLVQFQISVAMQGHFVRGGWAVGNLFMNQNTVFGSALLDAHHLESSYAVFPRIVLSPEMKDYVLHHIAFYSSDAPQYEDLLIDAKGDVMTNYLAETIVDGRVNWALLEKHSQIISTRLSEYSSNERVLPKYQWLAAYHNFFCDLVRKGEGYSDAVRVVGAFPDYGLRSLKREDSPYPPSAKKAWM